jgi:DNA-directed RNA polymerase II subunit RPB1
MIDITFHTNRLTQYNIDNVTLPIDIEHIIESIPLDMKKGICCKDIDLEELMIKFKKETKYENNILESIMILSLRPILDQFDRSMMNSMFVSMIDEYLKSQVISGDMVGIMSSECLTEGTTQGCLNQFHSTGTSKKETSSGLSRICELIDHKKTTLTPSMSFRLNKNVSNPIQKLEKLLYQINFEEIVSPIGITMEYLPHLNDYNKLWIDIWKKVTPQNIIDNHFKKSPYVLIINLKDMLPYSLDYIKNILLNIFSKSNIIHSEGIGKNELHIRSQIINDEISKLKPYIWVRQMEYKKLNYTCEPLKSRMINRKVEYYIPSSNKNSNMSMNSLNKICKRYIDLIMKKSVSPPSKIKNVFQSEIDSTLFETNGCDFDLVIQNYKGSHYKNIYKKYNNNLIDWRTIIPNDIHYTIEKFGIEAGCVVLLKELKLVMESNGSYQNPRHLMLIVDILSQSGDISPFTRHGIKNKSESFLAKASFEEPLSQFINAAMNQEIDNIVGCSERVMMGRMIKSGTGIMDSELIPDLSMVENAFDFNLEEDNIITSQIPSPTFNYNIQQSPLYGPPSPLYGPPSPLYGKLTIDIPPSSPSWGVKSPIYYSSSPYNEKLTIDIPPSSPSWGVKSPIYNIGDKRYNCPIIHENNVKKYISEIQYSPSSPAMEIEEEIQYSPSSPAMEIEEEIQYSPSSPAMEIEDMAITKTIFKPLIGHIIERSMLHFKGGVEDLKKSIVTRTQNVQTPQVFKVKRNVVFNL